MHPLGALAGGVFAALFTFAAVQAAEPFAVKVEPYAGARLGDTAEAAQPGAAIEFGPAAQTKDERLAARLKAMGVQDGASFGDAGRWYLFVGGSGTAVGLNIKREPDGPLRSRGLSVDPAAAVGDVQAGMGFRKGDVQTSIGYVHRTFKPAYGMKNMDFDNKDEMVGISFSLKAGPRR